MLDPTITSFDTDDDGNIDRIEINYDADGDGITDKVVINIPDDGSEHVITTSAGTGPVENTAPETTTSFKASHAGGSTETVTYYAADDNGNAVGDPLRIETNEYNDSDVLTQTAFDDDANGTPERVVTREEGINAIGQKTETLRSYEGVSVTDGVLTQTTVHTYNSDDKIIETVIYTYPDGLAGGISQTVTHSYDDDGVLTGTEFAGVNGDPTVEISHRDTNGDGNPDLFIEVEENGILQSSVDLRDFERDYDGANGEQEFDGERDDQVITKFYDDAGVLVRQVNSFENDNDGLVDRFVTRTFIDGAVDKDNIVTETITREKAGDEGVQFTNPAVVERILTKIFLGLKDDQIQTGRVVEQRFDDSGSGQIDRILTRTFDADGNLTERVVASDVDESGTPQKTVTHKFRGIEEGDGAVLRERVEKIHNEDGSTVETTQTYLVEGEPVSLAGNLNLGVLMESVVKTFAPDATSPERVETSTYEDGVLMESVVETFAPDATSPERVETSTYEDGVLLKSVVEIDTNGDGSRVISEQSEYEDGYLISKMTVDGNVFFPGGDPVSTTTTEYDLNGKITQTIEVKNTPSSDGQNITRTETFFKDSKDNLTERWKTDYRDFVNDVATEIETEFYDAANNLVKTTTNTDVDANGIVDSTMTVFEAIVDDAGLTHTKTEFDDNADGFVDRVEDEIRENFAFISKTTEYRFDDNGDGTVDRIRIDTHEGETSDRIVSSGFDDNADGIVDRIETRDYSVVPEGEEGAGNLVETVSYITGDDPEADPDRIETYTYSEVPDGADGAGNQVETVSYFTGNDLEVTTDNGVTTITDGGAEVSPDRSETHTYDGETAADSRVIHTEFVNGTVIRTEAYSYDDVGRVVEIEFDGAEATETADAILADGTVDRIETRVYSEIPAGEEGAGNLVETVSYITGDDPEADPDRIETHTYEGTTTDSRVIHTEFVNGTVIRSEAYRYDEEGRLVETAFDDDPAADNGVDRIETYDEEGSLSSNRVNDPASNEYTIYFYNEAGNINKREEVVQHYDGDGNFVIRLEKTVFTDTDTNGEGGNQINRVIEDLEDRDGDGTTDLIVTYTYEMNNDDILQSISRRFDDDGDGIYNKTVLKTFEDGVKTSVLTRFNDDDRGVNDRFVEELFDANGVRERYTVWNENPAPGVPVQPTGEWIYKNGIKVEGFYAVVDDQGRIESGTRKIFVDGVVESVTKETYTYDVETGLIARTDFDDDGDGASDRNATHVFEYDDVTGGLIETISFDVDPDAGNGVDRVETHTYYADGGALLRSRAQTVKTDTYDADGRVTRTDFDDDGDGDVDRAETHSYDDEGRLIRTEFDTDGDDRTNRTEVYSYDDEGRLETIAFDDNDNGVTDRSETYSYDSAGRLETTEFDDAKANPVGDVIPADGTVDRIETRTYTDNNLVETVSYFTGADPEADPARTEAYSYDDVGNLITIAFDDDPAADNGVDRTETYTYDVSGRVNTVAFDDDPAADNGVDRTEAYTYDARGRVNTTAFDGAEATETEAAILADGTVDRTEAYRYDATGRLIRTTFDDGADGTVDRIVSREYELDDYSNLIETVSYVTGVDEETGVLDGIETHTYNAAGRVTQSAFDTDGDGSVDRLEFFYSSGLQVADAIFTYTYDDEGNLKQTEFDNNNDGSVDRTEAYTYNDEGRLETTRIDRHAEGSVEFEIREYIDNTDGTLIETISYITGADPDADPDRIETNTYNADGNVIRTEFDDAKANSVGDVIPPDGTVDKIMTYTYDDEGRLETIEFDNNADEIRDSITTNVYDDEGRRVYVEFDDDGDGSPDERRFDDNGNGFVNRIETYTYAAAGDVSKIAFDDNANSTVDRTEAYTYDEEDRVKTVAFDGAAATETEAAVLADGTVDRIETYTYAAAGDVDPSEIAFDDNGNGTDDRSEAYTYYEDGSLKQTDFDNNANDQVDHRVFYTDDGNEVAARTETYTYAAAGDVNPEQTDFDHDANGTVDRSEFYDVSDGSVIRTETHTYNAAGNLVSTDFYDADGNNDVDDKVDRREIDTDGDNIADQTLTFEYGGDVGAGTNFVKIREEGNDQVLLQGTDVDGDGQSDRFIFTNTEAFEFRLTENDAQSAEELDTVTLSGNGESTLILSDDAYSIIANEDANHVLTINGDDNDTVLLTGDWTEDTSDGDSSYLEYENDDGYTLSIQAGVSVTITDDPFAL